MKTQVGKQTTQRLSQIINAPGGSYLFNGPRGVGKFSAALELGEQLISDPRALLVIENDKASLGIDLIHGLNSQLQLKGTGNHRVAVIRDAEKLTIEAQNAFLKTLEEPPLGTTIILVTADRGKLLPTILSRVQPIHFEPQSGELIKNHLLGQGIAELEADRLVDLAEGALGQAVTLAGDQEAAAKFEAAQTAAKALVEPGDLYNKLRAVAQAQDTTLLIERLISELRAQIRAAGDDLDILKSLQAKLSAAEMAWRYLAANVNAKAVTTQLALEMAP